MSVLAQSVQLIHDMHGLFQTFALRSHGPLSAERKEDLPQLEWVAAGPDGELPGHDSPNEKPGIPSACSCSRPWTF